MRVKHPQVLCEMCWKVFCDGECISGHSPCRISGRIVTCPCCGENYQLIADDSSHEVTLLVQESPSGYEKVPSQEEFMGIPKDFENGVEEHLERMRDVDEEEGEEGE